MLTSHTQFREGMSVTCFIDDTLIEDAKLHLESDTWFLCQNNRSGMDCSNKIGYRHSWSLGSVWHNGEQNVTDMKTKHATIIAAVEGEYISTNYGNPRKVLGVCGSVYHLSVTGDYTRYDVTMSLEELKGAGFKPVEVAE